jgi:hypothetical protein
MNEPDIRLEGDKLVIVVDVSKAALDAAPASKSGKTRMVCTTHGFAKHGPVSISLNIIAPQVARDATANGDVIVVEPSLSPGRAVAKANDAR